MSVLAIKDGNGNTKYLDMAGTGTSDDPFIPISGDFELEVAIGNVPSHSFISKFGRNNDIDIATTPEDLWESTGLYTGQPTGAAETMEILSSSAQDGAAGTGALTVEISNLLDSTGAVSPNVTVTMNGATPVSLGAITYTRATRMKVKTAGSTGAAVGTITLRHTTTVANVFGTIIPTKTQTNILAYTVPLGKTLYTENLQVQMSRASGSSGSAEVQILQRPSGGVYELLRNPDITNQQSFNETGIFVIVAKTDIVFRITTVSDNNTVISGHFKGILIDD